MFRFNVIRLRDYILPSVFLLFIISLLLFSSTNLAASKSGLSLWANSVVPSLFPFFVATELISKTQIPFILGRFLNIFMRPFFNVSGEGSFALIMGLISGYPTGAKIAVNFRNNNILPKEECERLLSFTNNSGPLFIIGTIGISIFGNSSIGFLLLITHILSCFSVGFIFRFWKYSSTKKTDNSLYTHNIYHNNLSLSNLGYLISDAISSSIKTILIIGGFIVLFSIIISIFKTSNVLNFFCIILTPLFNFFKIPEQLISSILVGILEITNGISMISLIKIKDISICIILASFLLGTGGLSVFMQVFSIVSESDLSMKPYILGKLSHGIFASFYTYLFITFIPLFNFNL